MASNSSGTATTASAVRLLEQAAAIDRARLAGLTDAVTLAAEQVQDKRLEYLEQGPDVQFRDAVLSFMLTFLLSAPLVGRATSAFAERVLAPRVAGAIATRELALQRIAARGNPKLDVRISKSIDEIQRSIQRLQNANSALSHAGEISNYATAIAGAWQSSPKAPSGQLNATDTPGVALQRAVRHFVAENLYALEIERTFLTELVVTKAITPAKVAELCARPSLDVPSLAEGSDMCSRHFEALIWTMLILENHRATGRSPNGTYATTIEQLFGGLTNYLPARMVPYFVSRFVDPTTGRPFAAEPQVYDPAAKRMRDVSAGALGRHLLVIARAVLRNGLQSFVRSNADYLNFAPKA